MMEIKTLAQILAENENKAAKPAKKVGKRSTKTAAYHTQNKGQESEALTSAQRAFKKKNRASYNDKKNERYQANKTQTSNQEASHLSDDSSTVESESLITNEHPSTATPKRKKRKPKPFHPASPYAPKQQASHRLESVKELDSNSIKKILASVKSENNVLGNASPNDPSNHDDFDGFKSRGDYSNNEHSTNNDRNTDSFNANGNDTDNNDDNDTNTDIDNLPAALKAYLKTPEQRQAEKEEIKANSRLRWLAFYYLSRREHSKNELRQKLLDKEQDPSKIEALLEEFSEKGYQSEYRTALMLIREGIRKRRGRMRIKNDFYQRKVAIPANIDELIDMAMEESDAFADDVSNNDLVDGVDWLGLAVEARVKKYGAAIPTEPKVKARQLRFLQYRGFQPDICFQAIGLNLETLDDRF